MAKQVRGERRSIGATLGALARAWADAYLAALALVAAELIVVAIAARGELGGLWEVARVVLGLLPVATAAAG
ncbi:MAG: hypothetical protein JRI23_20950, partial [Deltaproteobacteria bacterium]|nr:hypothetical protein [Deltaproteobacteria bacterium]MBW2534393.1 hypothetical protein [Deltaproteobacteria bacterium]